MIDKYRVNMRAGQENIIFDRDSILRDSTIDRTTFQPTPTVIRDNLAISQISQVAPEQIITSLKDKLVALSQQRDSRLLKVISPNKRAILQIQQEHLKLYSGVTTVIN